MSAAIGVVVPGNSLVHRAPPGAKLLALAAVCSVLVLRPTPTVVASVAALTAGGYVLAGLSARVAVAQVRPLGWFLAALVTVQVLFRELERGLLAAGALVLAVLAAGLVTATTPVPAMLDTITRAAMPLRHVGIDPEQVALVLALAIRAVAVLHELAAEVRDAHTARGLPLRPRTFVVPVTVRALRHADELAEALAARGLG